MKFCPSLSFVLCGFDACALSPSLPLAFDLLGTQTPESIHSLICCPLQLCLLACWTHAQVHGEAAAHPECLSVHFNPFYMAADTDVHERGSCGGGGPDCKQLTCSSPSRAGRDQRGRW